MRIHRIQIVQEVSTNNFVYQRYKSAMHPCDTMTIIHTPSVPICMTFKLFMYKICHATKHLYFLKLPLRTDNRQCVVPHRLSSSLARSSSPPSPRRRPLPAARAHGSLSPPSGSSPPPSTAPHLSPPLPFLTGMWRSKIQFLGVGDEVLVDGGARSTHPPCPGTGSACDGGWRCPGR